jgi:Zn ribbon nucleic-acid-binding protein
MAMVAESVFVKHESCPQCKSRNNLGVWSDGHKWCFGCGYYEPPTGSNYEYVRRVLKPKENEQRELQLPSDASLAIPKEARDWMMQYLVFNDDILQYDIRYSEAEKGLIFSVKDEQHKLVFYQMRMFKPGPKYITRGRLGNHIPVLKMSMDFMDPVSSLVVVEDYLSAIRVSEWMDCMPLFGSHLDKKTAVRLATMYNDIYLWLDPDKAAQAMKFKGEYEAIFDNFHVILTDKDPKEYAPNDIYDYLMDADAGIVEYA